MKEVPNIAAQIAKIENDPAAVTDTARPIVAVAEGHETNTVGPNTVTLTKSHQACLSLIVVRALVAIHQGVIAVDDTTVDVDRAVPVTDDAMIGDVTSTLGEGMTTLILGTRALTVMLTDASARRT